MGPRFQETGIFKKPRKGPVRLTSLGLFGDVQVDKKHHGGVDQAVYLYSWSDYEWWAEELGQELAAGTFGENITLESFGAEPCCVGDRLRCGQVLLELTAPRIPCATLACRLEDMTFVKQFAQAGRPGYYARVLSEGELVAGEEFEWVSRGTFPLDEVYGYFFGEEPTAERVLELLEQPLAERLREQFGAE